MYNQTKLCAYFKGKTVTSNGLSDDIDNLVWYKQISVFTEVLLRWSVTYQYQRKTPSDKKTICLKDHVEKSRASASDVSR